MLERLDKCSTKGHKAETDDKQWDIVLWANDLQEDIAGHFDKHINDVEDGSYPVEADTNQVEVFSHSLDTRISNVGSELGSML